MGVRVLDLRFDSRLRIAHTFSNDVALEEALEEVRKFLDDNPTEFVMLMLCEDYRNSTPQTEYEGFVDWIRVVLAASRLKW